MKKKKYIIKKGKVVLNKPAKPKAKLIGYERYVNIAKGIGIRKSEILNENEYITAVAGEKSRRLPTRPKDIAYKQKYLATERQTKAYWKAYKRTAVGETMTYKQFINKGIHHDVKEVVKERYDQLKEYYKDQLANDDMKLTVIANIISSEFFGS